MLRRPDQFPTNTEGASGAVVSQALCSCYTPEPADLVAEARAKPFCLKMGFNYIFWCHLLPVTRGNGLTYLV